ncbi:MAG: bifunctional phosphopantothenoylcysteine decarboxylase/phosphopantothenate--cysteine ligase CoaBC, partial [Lachnospiraceae bacterium]|nr:bifunctional phosphopantothenoylcysteine decarboxylase/phosphopantothenate--cysteine ligase CoaBC [Lachnospiraceae bacterium]
VLFQYIVKETVFAKDLLGKTALVTAGPTREAIDPVRFITNHSTGKMGYALAYNLAMRGAEVRLVSGPVSISAPPFVDLINVESAADMAEAVKEYAYSSDIIIKAAAVADYRPSEPSTEKIKKTDGDAVIRLERTEDILAYLGVNKRADQFICGFSMETENLLENSVAKLHRKNVDMIVANSLKTPGAGFGTDTNVVTIITEAGVKELPLMSKDEVAGAIVDEILRKIS